MNTPATLSRLGNSAPYGKWIICFALLVCLPVGTLALMSSLLAEI